MSQAGNFQFELESKFVSSSPDVLATPSQISYPSAPKFKRLDIPEKNLHVTEVNLNIQEQLSHVSVLSERIDTARSFIPFLYSYRSVNLAFMRDESIKKAINTPNVQENQSLFDVKSIQKLFKEYFEPKINIFLDLMTFSQSLSTTVSGVIKNEKYEPTDVLFEKLIELFDIMFNIDQMKLIKTGINNDLSFYKRDKDLVSGMNSDGGAMIAAQKLQIFLASQNAALDSFKLELINKLPKGSPNPENPRSYIFLSKFLEYCVKSYKNDALVPKQRNSIVVAMVCILYIHNHKEPAYNIFTAPCIHEVFEILHSNPVVPLYGENSFVPGYILQKVEGFINDKKFPMATKVDEIKNKESEYLIKNHIQRFRVLYRDNLSFASKMAREGKVTVEGLINLLTCLSEMTLFIQKQSSLKFILTAPRPASVPSQPDPYLYDLAVKLNYTHADLDSLAELIGYIKTLAATTLSAQHMISDFVFKNVNGIVQEFIQNTLERPLVRAKSANDADAVRLLEAIRDTFGQWRGAIPNDDLPKKTNDIVLHKIEPSIVPITVHQLDILRVLLYSIIADNSSFRESKGLFTWSHFRPKHVKLTQEFLKICRPWYHLLDYCSVLREATNLGFLWFRETSLDMDKVLQFPVRSSLPFILAEHLLQDNSKPSLHDSVFFPFELYNDAAAQAINVYDSQYLYREIEAEADLCINMIAFSFSEVFYRFCRETAAAMELPPECMGRISPTPMRFSVMVQQNKMELLGSAVDFNYITTSKLNIKIQKELESYLALLNDIRMAPVVAHLTRMVKTTHSLLLENHLLMDDFDMIWQKACGFESPLSLDSRLATTISSLLDFQHLCLNVISRRYLHLKPCILEAQSTDQWWKEYILLHKHEMNYIGVEHIRAIVELLSPGELSHIINVCMNRLESNLIKIIEVYTAVAPSIRLLPAISKDDIVGFFSFNSDAYNSLTHPQMRRLFDLLRSFGNIVSFIWYLDNELPPNNESTTILGPMMNTIKQILLDHKELFFGEGILNLESIQSHRSFASLWSVIEFLVCSPKAFKINTESATNDFDYFGDGLIFAAHIIITICDQISLYKIDSICFRALELNNAENSQIPKNDLSQFLLNSSVADQSRKFAELITSPFKIIREKEE